MNDDFDYLEEKKQDLIQEYLIQRANMKQEDNNNDEYEVEEDDWEPNKTD